MLISGFFFAPQIGIEVSGNLGQKAFCAAFLGRASGEANPAKNRPSPAARCCRPYKKVVATPQIFWLPPRLITWPSTSWRRTIS